MNDQIVHCQDTSPAEELFHVTKTHRSDPLRDCVREALSNYFAHLNGHRITNLYDLVLAEVEGPLLRTVLEHTGGNQTQAAALLGISRSTLRKKLAQYDIA
jgi:Fis family transcriptional regulator, factor for inversion stimulation protein